MRENKEKGTDDVIGIKVDGKYYFLDELKEFREKINEFQNLEHQCFSEHNCCENSDICPKIMAFKPKLTYKFRFIDSCLQYEYVRENNDISYGSKVVKCLKYKSSNKK